MQFFKQLIKMQQQTCIQTMQMNTCDIIMLLRYKQNRERKTTA